MVRCITGKLLHMVRFGMMKTFTNETSLSKHDSKETEFQAIVNNDALTSKSNFSPEPTVSSQHVNEVNSKSETSLSKYDRRYPVRYVSIGIRAAFLATQTVFSGDQLVFRRVVSFPARTNNLITNTPTPTDPIQADLAAIQETLANIQAKVRTHTTEIANLKRGEGTSQPRTGELTGQPSPHPEPNTPYGKLIKIEFTKFSGDKVKDWVYRCKQFFKVDGVPDGRKIQLASMHVFDAALVWYQHYMKKYPDNTLWEHFKVEVVKRFGVLY
ncbi:hypothetical protein Tco_0705569 [Tanacetum coccineum]|uniref:Retrotransposon gag domain-containing protein n=1 Tax=Tanacetum coccineum TaxID=301880 RepID=A0ABQ4Y6H6_9ASTR